MPNGMFSYVHSGHMLRIYKLHFKTEKVSISLQHLHFVHNPDGHKASPVDPLCSLVGVVLPQKNSAIIHCLYLVLIYIKVHTVAGGEVYKANYRPLQVV
jgi:hypothetical protein